MHARVFGLDLLRAIAILLVLLLHTTHVAPDMPYWLARLFNYGWLGVDLFFVLSGYLIGKQALSESENSDFADKLNAFWKRRWTRTLPLYFTVLFVYAVVKPYVFNAPFIGFSSRYFFFFQNTLPMKDFVQSWSLCIEEQFYLLFPLIVFLVKPRRAEFWLLFIGVSFAMRYLTWSSMHMPWFGATQIEVAAFDTAIRFRTLSHLDSIAMGVFLAATRDTWSTLQPKLRHFIGMLGVVLVVLTATWSTYAPGDFRAVVMFTLIALGFGATLVAWGDLREPPGWFAKPVRHLALWSYGAYLWNNLFIRALDRYELSDGWIMNTAVFMVGTLVLSAVTYHLIELPGLRLRDIRLRTLFRRV